ncbi:hypothetical protein TPHA_0L01090 [Tetrapisispora phaffii CBS 4417]|uniref:Ribosome assembly protein 3 n=1 Tax=Tetrapisispora phaffii (strain ATCC 24235 / CBS 4417 / NBRC 1672 / NRRL Y-8282 / UCD 70-5) TaxID=1071381 RepID=G8BZY8_TETPH|nr:hypothetical protein TPHA_0L01090 [Tetrapisispora phaffii CBS 4417]CCE65466.1 hypothetical protein TPHA_0L01090 [Tetrapisispora phaffii CBS 4417]
MPVHCCYYATYQIYWEELKVLRITATIMLPKNVGPKKDKSSRRKKRRTAESSDSSSSSSSESDIEVNDDEPVVDQTNKNDGAISFDVPAANKSNLEILEDKTIEKLNEIPFTMSDLSKRIPTDKKSNEKHVYDYKQIEKILESDSAKLDAIYDSFAGQHCSDKDSLKPRRSLLEVVDLLEQNHKYYDYDGFNEEVSK